MSKTIIVAGFGSGISNAVAEKFGGEGFTVALVARNADRLATGVKTLEAKGVKAAAFPTDLGDATAVRGLVKKVRETFGAVTVLHWNAYSTAAPDLLSADTAAIHGVIDVAVSGLLAGIQEALPDLRRDKEASAILVTNGGLGFFDPNVDATAVQWNAMGLALANAAKHKTVGMLAQKLKTDGVYVGEVVVNGTVKGTAWDQGNATLDAKTIADKFWELYRARKDVYAQLG